MKNVLPTRFRELGPKKLRWQGHYFFPYHHVGCVNINTVGKAGGLASTGTTYPLRPSCKCRGSRDKKIKTDQGLTED